MAIWSKGNVTLEVNTGTSSSPTWSVVPGFFQFDGGGTTLERQDATNFNSTGNRREFVSTFVTDQPITYEMHYTPGNAVQEAIRDAADDGSILEARMTFGEEVISGGETYTFDSHVENYGLPRGPIDGLLAVSFQLSPTGAGVWA